MYLFDFDGTLVDSNGVWVEIDNGFLARRGLTPTREYSDTVGHSIFPIAAQFTKDYYCLDMTPEAIGFALERLLEAGALDAWTTPIGMKKSRPGVLLSALCRPEKRQAVLEVFLHDTTTLGVREHRCSRTALQRSVSETDSPWGPVRCKQAGGYGVSRKKYEFDDLARIARETGLSLPELLEKLP